MLLSVLLILSGCVAAQKPENKDGVSENRNVFFEEAETVSSDISAPTAVPKTSYFTERDLSADFSAEDAVYITLSDKGNKCDSNAVSVETGLVNIRSEGIYIVDGSLSDGSIVIDADKQDKIQLVLNGVSIHSETGAPIYIKQADKVFITLADKSENTLSNGGVFEEDTDASVDAVIFSKDDLTVNGSGSLTVDSPAGHGIVSKDDLTVCGGSITVFALSHGLSGKDTVGMTGAVLDIESGKDGIHAENKDDDTLGSLYIKDGTYRIRSEGDCISAATDLQIDGGTFDLISGGGSENAEERVEDDFGPGGMMPPGGMGGNPGGGHRGRTMSLVQTSTAVASDSEEAVSQKGIKSGTLLDVLGGSFVIDSADDAVHSNGDLNIFDGDFSVETGDDGFHADAALYIENGSILISESYEGLEGLSIQIADGHIDVTASDDGLNAAGGTDQSGFGGMHGGDMFAADPNSFIEVSGGTLAVNAYGDGIDSNGSLNLSGGSITLCGPTAGDTAVLDYASNGIISGASFVGTGSSMMAQSLSSDTQGVIALGVGNQSAGTTATISASDGTELLSVTPELDYAIVIFSCPEMKKGESYTVTIGSVSKDFTAN